MIISQKYEVQKQIGQGSMGVVYKVRHVALETISALKVLPLHLMGNPDLMKRFYREARVMARLNHPNIVRVIDIHKDDELQFHYFVMEFIEGQTLWEYLQNRGPLPLSQVIGITRQVARALDYAHSYTPPVIHRDIKPSNIMIEGRSRVVVMDFGIAKELDQNEMTQAGTLLGTLKYCPPEQMRHEPLDGSADIYALGMVMYEAYTGIHPLNGLDEYALVGRVLEPQDYDLSFPPNTPPAFAKLVTRAVAKSRVQRYRQMSELLQDLDACCPDLDETRLQLPSIPWGLPQLNATAQEDDTELEEQIYRLEEERGRRVTAKLEIQAREAQERAAREGARQLAQTLFQDGCQHEEQGREHFRHREYGLARQAFEAAITLYAKAHDQAVAEALIRQAGQAREEMAAAKVEADRFGAKERAGSFYTQALMLQAQADALWDHQSYGEAWQIYGEACNGFENAHELAYRALLEEEAKEAQAQTKAARELAVKEAAEEFASELFWDAMRSERRGDVALGHEEFTQARELYRKAAQDYQRAQLTVQHERQCREARSAQQHVEAARQAAEAAGATTEQDFYRRAQALQHQGDNQLANAAYTAAIQVYHQARTVYEQAGHVATQAHRRQLALAAQACAEERAAKAVQVGARERYPEAAIQAEQIMAEGHSAQAKESFTKALACYEAAVEAWERLHQETEFVQARERAEAARGRMHEVRGQEDVLRRWATSAWVSADRAAAEAEAAWQQQDYIRASEIYDSVNIAYEQAVQAAIQERDQQYQASEIRRQVQGFEQTAAQLPIREPEFSAAAEAKRRGEIAWDGQRWPEATVAYTEARQLLQCLIMSQAEQRREAAARARHTAEPHSHKAQYQDLFQQADVLRAEAEERWQGADYPRAERLYTEACTLFEELARGARLDLLRDGAEAERARTAAAREAALSAGAPELATTLFEEATRRARQADAAWGKEEYTQAQERYRTATDHYQGAEVTAQHARQRHTLLLAQQQAEAAQREAENAQRAAANAEAPHYAQTLYQQAQATKAQGDASLAAQHYGEAAEKFFEAQAGFNKSREQAQRVEAQRDAKVARAQAADAQREAREGPADELFPERYAEAETMLEQAEQCFRQHNYRQAQALFSQGHALFQELHHQVTRSLQRQQAEQSRARAMELTSRLNKARAWRKWRVQRLMRRADRLFTQHAFSEARTHYEAAVNLLASLPRATPILPQTHPPTRSEPKLWRTGLTGPGKHISLSQRPKLWRTGLTLVILLSAMLTLYQTVDTPEPPLSAPPAPLLPIPPLDPRPSITAVSPAAEGTITIAEGDRQVFSVTAESPTERPLHYTWFLDGVQTAQGEQWTYQPDFSEGGPATKEVRVVVADLDHRAVDHSWQIKIVNVNQRPRFEQVSPAAESQSVAPGERVEFSVQAIDPDPDDQLSYAWFLDGQQVAEGKHWQFTVPVEAGSHQVELVVRDQDGLFVRRTWQISTRPAPPSPRIEVIEIYPELVPGQTLTLAEGQSQVFKLKANSTPKAALKYTWFLDGKKVAEGDRWTYQPDYLQAQTSPHEVKGIVAGLEDRRLEQVWRVRVTDVNRAPEVRKAVPHDTQVELTSSERQSFSIEATDADSDGELTYIWSLDGQEVGRGKTWQPDQPLAEGQHSLVVRVIDQVGLATQRTWRLTTPAKALPPEIVEFTPRTPSLTTDLARSLDFSVTATRRGARGGNTELRYQWTLDDQPQTTSAAAGHFKLSKAAPGRHELRVVAISPDGLSSAPRSWVVEVKPRATGLQENEIRRWLEVYRQAWEKKDIESLIQLGGVSSSNATKLREVLSSYQDFRVDFKDIKIQIEGKQATVSLARVDTIDGRTLPQPGRTVFVLEKNADGRIARRPE